MTGADPYDEVWRALRSTVLQRIGVITILYCTALWRIGVTLLLLYCTREIGVTVLYFTVLYCTVLGEDRSYVIMIF